MSLWALLPMVLSVGTQVLGGKTATDAAVEGAESQASMEQANREFQHKTFNEMIEKQKPFIEAGREAVPLYAEAVRGRGEPMTGGLAQMQKRLLEEDTGSMTGHIRKITQQRLEAEEGERYKGRLMDMQKIGLGSSASAGQSAVNLGGALAGSYAREGNIMAQSRVSEAIGKQNLWLETAQSLSGLPSFFSAKSGGGTTGGSGMEGYTGALTNPMDTGYYGGIA